MRLLQILHKVSPRKGFCHIWYIILFQIIIYLFIHFILLLLLLLLLLLYIFMNDISILSR
jgi:hypothetical protein